MSEIVGDFDKCGTHWASDLRISETTVRNREACTIDPLTDTAGKCRQQTSLTRFDGGHRKADCVAAEGSHQYIETDRSLAHRLIECDEAVSFHSMLDEDEIMRQSALWDVGQSDRARVLMKEDTGMHVVSGVL